MLLIKNCIKRKETKNIVVLQAIGLLSRRMLGCFPGVVQISPFHVIPLALSPSLSQCSMKFLTSSYVSVEEKMLGKYNLLKGGCV